MQWPRALPSRWQVGLVVKPCIHEPLPHPQLVWSQADRPSDQQQQLTLGPQVTAASFVCGLAFLSFSEFSSEVDFPSM